MKHSESYTISPPSRFKFFRWLRYLGIILAIVYFWLTIDSYQQDGWVFTTILNGLTGVIWLGITYSYFRIPVFGSKIGISSDGITFKEQGEPQSIGWKQLQRINMTNNSIFLSLENNPDKELNISYLEYKQLQEAKKRIQSFSTNHQIEFSSKY
ncbi:hypothetical protein [Fodinibius salsisoli]|uniref:PH domain-containing protein n=1 Tax=Fodinibius salsisoli TaxID=2820877 RepID=A0ABT3PNS6_9BACT|nr:hypothetical protein [Fodinibius salsisoli]MCW9707516.1 hypothetical protein [Fodinibius salsisoli]